MQGCVRLVGDLDIGRVQLFGISSSLGLHGRLLVRLPVLSRRLSRRPVGHDAEILANVPKVHMFGVLHLHGSRYEVG